MYLKLNKNKMNKITSSYYLQKEKKAKEIFAKIISKIDYQKDQQSDLKKQFQNKIEIFTNNLFKLNNLNDYYIECSFLNRFRLYYHPTSNLYDKKEILEIEFIYDKNKSKILDFNITNYGFKFPIEVSLNNINIITKILKISSKKDIFLKKYNNIYNSYFKKYNFLDNKISHLFVKLRYLKETNYNLYLQYVKQNSYNKELLFSNEFQQDDHFITLPFSPNTIYHPISLKIEPLDSNSYNVIIKSKDLNFLSLPLSIATHKFSLSKKLLDEVIENMVSYRPFSLK